MKINDNEVIKKLKLLGLNTREAKVYVALLRLPEASAADLGRVSEFPRTKIYEVISQMVTKGFCAERQEGNKKFYRATRPRELGDQLELRWKQERTDWIERRNIEGIARRSKWEMEQREKWERKLDVWEAEGAKWEKEHANRLANASEIFESLDHFFMDSTGTSPGLEKVEAIQSKEQMSLRFLKLLRGTESEMLGFCRSPYVASDERSRQEQAEENESMLARGVTVRDVYMDEETQHHWLPAAVAIDHPERDNVRFSDNLPIKMFISDRKTVTIPIPTVPGLSGGDFTLLCVNDPGFVEACCMLFESAWAKGFTFDEWVRKHNFKVP